ncbi:DnaB-like helicase C-terminal domain-containing protein [Pseudomonas sp. MH10]|nr:DnaB-like helicase C-terminal domain-containing protein [Pseudomonas sp. MH10]MEB0122317.1 DnaB-like helicase C-terminal domain-containing protein [Pseudomonas sp. CCI1.2]
MKVLEQVDFNFNHGDGVTGVPSGLADLDQKTGGFQDADLIIVAARPSMGKTSLALNFVDAVLQKRPTGSVQIYSLEMPAISAGLRALAKEFDCPVVALSQLGIGKGWRLNTRQTTDSRLRIVARTLHLARKRHDVGCQPGLNQNGFLDSIFLGIPLARSR